MRGRPVVDVVVLAFTATVCVVLVVVTIAVVLAGTIPPNDPLASRYLDVIMTATATVLGALLGLLAGRRPTRPNGVEGRDVPPNG